jgi:hypothetical protein
MATQGGEAQGEAVIGALLDTTKSLLGTALNAITRKPL